MEDFQGYVSTGGQRCSLHRVSSPLFIGCSFCSYWSALWRSSPTPGSQCPSDLWWLRGLQKLRRQHHLESSFPFTKVAGLSFLSHSRPMSGQSFCFRLSSS